MLSRIKPRDAQIAILEYTHGWMGISAVPGSGKTYTLSALAATLLAEERLAPDQEVLIVTLVNSAVNNFSQRIAGFMQGEGLLPDIGYRVRTLHGLANDILRERPDLAGLSDRFDILDERESNQILQDVSVNWLKAHPQFIDEYIDPGLNDYQASQARREFPELVADIAGAFIRISKDQQATPGELVGKLAKFSARQPLLLQMGCEIYADYQRALAYRSSVDFDDLIRLALDSLQADPDYLKRLRYRWPYILEDEAQDSSRLQEEILKLLAGEEGNWVRVGDPNQAIYETFTTANPLHLIQFTQQPGVTRRDLPNSGRSTLSINRLANHLIEWVRQGHPKEELKDSLSEPLIAQSPPGDPQPNPEDNPDGIYLSHAKYSGEEEVNLVVKSVRGWLVDHPNQTAAVLVPRNERGAQVVTALKAAGMEPIELLRSSQSTRQTADLLASLIRALADPASTPKLVAAYRAIHRKELERKGTAPVYQAVAGLLQLCARLEDYLQPSPERDWLASLSPETALPSILSELEYFRSLVLSWQKATSLPIDQLLLTISQDLFSEPSELALMHKLALVCEVTAQNHPDWRLPEFAEELESVARNQRKFLGFAEEDQGFDPDAHKGRVVVATIHKAKGLEWDRVYLTSVNNYDFPAMDSIDTYYSEKYFLRGQLNLEAEILSLLRGILDENPALLDLEEGAATQEARQSYVAERLRLLFVGLTRARRELTVTWNTGRRGNCIPAQALLELQRWWEEEA